MDRLKNKVAIIMAVVPASVVQVVCCLLGKAQKSSSRTTFPMAGMKPSTNQIGEVERRVLF
jgi:hypothetical protein